MSDTDRARVPPMSQRPPDRPVGDRLADWVVESTLHGTRLDALLEGLCEGLIAAGIPLMRGHMAFGWLHPMVGSIAITWTRAAGLTRERHLRGESTAEWMESVPKALIDEGGHERRYRLERGEGQDRFPQLRALRDQGATDYHLTLTAFRGMRAAIDNRDGLIVSWTSDAPGGFTDRDIAVLHRLVPPLALAVKASVREEAARNVLSAYLGAGPGAKVLDGQIRLGDGEEISAVLWYCDLRGSTPTAEALGRHAFLEHLNHYFSCTAGAVLDHGGEVLRFIGDAVLAIFPTDGPGGEERAARLAISAARDARSRADKANAEAGADAPRIEFGLALHVGTVLYGNIGVPERVEFSVIGAAANEVARLEDLTKDLDRPILASDAFHVLAPPSLGAWTNLGPRHFRGVRRPQTVWALES
ncbi:adenylate/guanylate cyclase domain-containing protein [Marivibrio halodurans]|uniref:Adenylate/guanylate cyclase domain-containing protein n=1 Tax=Marivibrio halodurans TaxID=2039722 RepID=A0A8J7SJF0_9PROT|nr:adenylate/guanylate cyclase domain-containing protein [Marivibrio halodurans]MBP5855588.1 adenylate/guanylate cyclase domain-containing protein [Marivibrio halodurans]